MLDVYKSLCRFLKHYIHVYKNYFGLLWGGKSHLKFLERALRFTKLVPEYKQYNYQLH